MTKNNILSFRPGEQFPENITGKVFLEEIDKFFQYLWDTKESRIVMKKYEKIDLIKAMLSNLGLEGGK